MSGVDLLDGLDPEARSLVDLYLGTRRFTAGERILAKGEWDRAVYVLAAGSVLVEGVAGGLVLEAPDVVGEVSFLDGMPRSATVMGVTDGRLLRLSWESFESVRAESPDVAAHLALALGRALALRLRQQNERAVPAAGTE